MYYFHKKLKIKKNSNTKKKQKKNIFSGFLGGFLGVFWVSFFGWVFYCQPWLCAGLPEPGLVVCSAGTGSASAYSPLPACPHVPGSHKRPAWLSADGEEKTLKAVLWIRIGFSADPDPFFYLNVDLDPDPGSQTNWDPCGSGSWPVFKVARSLIFT